MPRTDCPTFTIHLDSPPEKRWKSVISYFKEYIPRVVNVAEDMLGKNTVALLTPLLNLSFHSTGIMHKEELIAISNQTNINKGLILLLQLVYEAFAACTSVVVKSETHPIHIRTMDWDLPILKKLTFQAKFKVKNKTLFTGTTWAGYIGMLTGMHHAQNKSEDTYSVSINYRQTPESYTTPYAEYLRNVYRTLKGYWPVSYLVRDVLTYEPTYHYAFNRFKTASLISPTYITICGTQNLHGAIITRNRCPNEPTYIQQLSKSTNLIQANMDHFNDKKYKKEKDKPPQTQPDMDIMNSRFRFSYVSLALNSRRPPSLEQFYRIMCIHPCYSKDLTIYTTIMIPYKKQYSTIINRDPEVYKKAKKELSKTVYYARRF